MIPSDIPVWLAAAGGALCIIVGREIFGGTGLNPFNPALTGLVLIRLAVPSAAPSMAQSSHGFFPLALLAGAVYLFARKNLKPHAAVAFVVAGLSYALLADAGSAAKRGLTLFNGEFMLGALFLANDPVTTPITKKGKAAFGGVCGLLAPAVGVTYSVLIANMLTPLFDEVMRPRRFGRT
jgi:electron transport complex protein RnfD